MILGILGKAVWFVIGLLIGLMMRGEIEKNGSKLLPFMKWW